VNELNAPQRQAVEHGSGPLLVFASAGSGKTSTLTRRIAHLVQSGVEPEKILAVTFTNKAAGEMEERLIQLIGEEATSVLWLGTFHATGARVLRALAAFANRRGDFSIYDDHDQLTVVKQVMDELGIDKKDLKPAEVRDRICKAKEKAIHPEHLKKSSERMDRELADIWLRYEAWLEASNAFDFEDLLLWPMRLAEGNDEAGTRLKNRFQHVLVDEFQDTSHTQWRFVKAMGEASGNIMVVGDDDQCHPGSTLVRRVMDDQTVRDVCIDTLRSGDSVLSMNIQNRCFYVREVTNVAKRSYAGEVLDLRIGESHRLVTATPEHKFVRKVGKQLDVCTAAELRPRDLLPTQTYQLELMGGLVGHLKLEYESVTSIESRQFVGAVYSLDVDKDHTYVANGVVVHNCIYEWRSADVSIIRGFADVFPSATVVKLEQNYRSTGNIVAAALDVIKTSKTRVDKRLWTAADAGSPVRVVKVTEDREEGRFIALELKQQGTDGAAVLYRTHQIARVIEEALVSSGLPYVVLGGPRFYDRKEVRDMLAYLRLVQSPDSNVDLLRAINVPSRGIGAAKIARLQEIAKRSGDSFWKATAELASGGELRPKEAEGLRRFRELVYAAMSAKLTHQGPKRIADMLISDSGYLDMWKAEEMELRALGKNAEADTAADRAKNVVEILSAIGDYEDDAKEAGKKPSLEGYLERVALMTSADKKHPEGAVVLMTIHAAKGLEFDRVYVAACEEGTLPYAHDTGDQNLDEERRLMYVAITRARRELTLSWSETRYFRGKLVTNSVSRFLEAISTEVSVDLVADYDGRLHPYEDGSLDRGDPVLRG
jgi:superfamily I DNA/RNA helicase